MKKILSLISIFLYSTMTHAFDVDLADICKFNHINYKQSVLFINTLKAELDKNNKQAIANMASFPLTINQIIKLHGKEQVTRRTIKDKFQFIKDYDTIFSYQLRSIIINDQEDIFCNYQGAMIADGAIWFNTENDKPAFFAVNIEMVRITN